MQARFAFAQTQPLQRMPFPVALHGQQGDIAIGVSAARKAEAYLIFPPRQLDGELSKRHPFLDLRTLYYIKGRSPTSSNGLIQSERVLRSTCVKRWRFFVCKVGFLLQDRTKFGTAGHFRQT